MKGLNIRAIYSGFVLTILIVVFSNVEAFEEIIEIESRPGVVLFSHGIHKDILCASCHHGAEVNTIIPACRNCHQKSTGKIKHAKEAFHETCIGCHLKDKKKNIKTGPAKLCSKCHIRRKNTN